MDGLDTSFVVDVVADGRRWWLFVGILLLLLLVDAQPCVKVRRLDMVQHLLMFVIRCSCARLCPVRQNSRQGANSLSADGDEKLRSRWCTSHRYSSC